MGRTMIRMRLVRLVLTLCAFGCGSTEPAMTRARRVVIEPDLQSPPEGGRCQERCGPYLHAGEVATCESVAIRGKLEDQLRYRDGAVCVLRPRETR